MKRLLKWSVLILLSLLLGSLWPILFPKPYLPDAASGTEQPLILRTVRYAYESREWPPRIIGENPHRLALTAAETETLLALLAQTRYRYPRYKALFKPLCGCSDAIAFWVDGLTDRAGLPVTFATHCDSNLYTPNFSTASRETNEALDAWARALLARLTPAQQEGAAP